MHCWRVLTRYGTVAARARCHATRCPAKLDGSIETRPAYDAAANVCFFTVEDSKLLIALDAATGKVLWKYYAEEEFNGSPSLAAGIVHAGSNDECVFRLLHASVCVCVASARAWVP